MERKKLLFVIESLNPAGAEKSLITLLNLLDYSRYEVDLQLFSYGGDFEALLPSEVSLLPELPYFAQSSASLKRQLRNADTSEKRKNVRRRLKYSVRLRMGKYTNPQKAVLFWQSAGECFDNTEKEYDVAIAYAQGVPTFYVADCVKAKMKFAWVNSIYSIQGGYAAFASAKYIAYTKIVCVSEAGRAAFCRSFPEHSERLAVVSDIMDGNMANRLALQENSERKDMTAGKVKILTVGRLSVQKGYDIAIGACRLLKEQGIDFCWYVLGAGALEADIKKMIWENDVENRFILLGTRANPYPYYKQADIYVQTSRFEGFGLAIAEARMLNTPVVTTRFDAVDAQMVDGENGLVVDMTPEAVAEGILRLIHDRELYEHIRDYQSKEKKGNYEEIEKFYTLIEG